MANEEHLAIFKQGVDAWNTWRIENSHIRPDFSHADLRKSHFHRANLSHADLRDTDLSGVMLDYVDLSKADLAGAYLTSVDTSHNANLSEANLSKASFVGATLIRTNLRKAILREARFSGAYLGSSDLSEADLQGADLGGVELQYANLSYANLSGADLKRANLSGANLTGANLTGCSIYAISAWDVTIANTQQADLVITREGEPTITVDNLEVAQFIYLLINNQKIRDIINTITSKVVLILGRFTEERKMVLEATRDELRKLNYTPVLCDFEKPSSRDFTETVRTLAHLAKFIIADLTEPSSIPQELQAIIPDLEVPVQPLLLEAKQEYSMFVDFSKYHWVLPIYLYKDQTSLIASLQKEIIEPAEKKSRELTIEKAKRLERQ